MKKFFYSGLFFLIGILFFNTSCKSTVEPELSLSINIMEFYDDNADSIYDRALISVSVLNPSEKDVSFEKYIIECFDEEGSTLFKKTVFDPYPYKLGGLDKYIWNNIYIKLFYDGKRVKTFKFTLFYLDTNNNYDISAQKNLY